jgi:hypothetical protein
MEFIEAVRLFGQNYYFSSTMRAGSYPGLMHYDMENPGKPNQTIVAVVDPDRYDGKLPTEYYDYPVKYVERSTK